MSNREAEARWKGHYIIPTDIVDHQLRVVEIHTAEEIAAEIERLRMENAALRRALELKP